MIAGVAGLLTMSDLRAVLGSPGAWVPLSLLVAMVAGAVLVRRAFRREPLSLSAERITVCPPAIRRVTLGQRERSLTLSEITQVRTVAGRHGVSLVLSGEAEAPPLILPLQHAGAPRIVEALREHVPESRWAPEAWTRLSTFRADAAAAERHPASDEAAALRFSLTAGLWHLAAEHTWPACLAQPTALEPARSLYEGERQRLPSAPRLRLSRALYRLHPEVEIFGLDAVRLALMYRLREDAQVVLDELVSEDRGGPVVAFWRRTLRERRALPAPGSKPSFGIEVNLPTHTLDGDVLVVQEQFRVELSWFLGYRLVPGFWAPVRALELVDLWGARHLLHGDPQTWLARLTQAAPHLCELHDEGLLWPPVGGRIRQLGATRPE